MNDLQRRLAAALLDLEPFLRDLGRGFSEAGFQLALVGGPVRDAALGRISPDLDFTTDARPDQIIQILRAWGDTHWEIGKEFGTIGARRGDQIVEVTTFRSDVYSHESRKPEVVFGDTLEADLVRRDFRVNAMAVLVPEMTFVDPHNGMADLADGVLRTPGAPELSFSDDPLRMLRAARFSAQLGLDVAPDVLQAMSEMADRLQIVSMERIQSEFVKTMLAAQPRRGLELLVHTGLADQFMPELSALKLEVDEHHRHKDVYEHTLTVVDQAIALEDGPDGPVPGPNLVLRLAALLHDIGKPATRRFESGGGVSFHHHEIVGAKLTAKRMKAMRFDKETTKQVARLVELHLRFHGYGSGVWTDSAVRRYVADAGYLLHHLHKLTRSDCTTRNRRKASRLSATYDDLEERIEQLAAAEQLAAVRPDLNGNDIMRILDLPAGPDVGKAWKYLKELRLEFGPMDPEVAEQRLRTWWQDQQSR